MRRRELLGLFGDAAVAAPAAFGTEPHPGIRRIGVLMATHADDAEGQAYAAALVQQLEALGWHQNGNLRIDWRWAGADRALFERDASELVALAPDVLVAFTSPAVKALRRKTRTIPVVFTVISDPLGQGFVSGLGHPGGNVTGFSVYDPPIAAKWLQLLKEIAPSVARAAALYNPSTAPFAGPLLGAIEAAGPSLGVAVRTAPVDDDTEIEATMTGLAREGRGGLLIVQGAFMIAHRDAIVALAARYRLPAIYPYRFIAEAGGLVSYGVEYPDLFRRAAGYVDRILKGEKPGDLPVQAPSKFDLVINLKTARALGLTVPPLLLARADEAIE